MESFLTAEQRLTEKLQQLLDLQWDSLVSAKGSQLVYTRHEITHAMSQLVYRVFEPKQRNLELAISEDKQIIKAGKDRVSRIDELQVIIDDTAKDERNQLAQADQDIVKINIEISELDQRVADLKQRKRQLIRSKGEIQSVIDSRTINYQDELKTLQSRAKEQPEDVLVQARIEVIQESLTRTQAEIKALKEGIALWTQACALVQTLETSMKSATSAEQLMELLSTTASQLESYLATATNNKWVLLSVALSHELQAVSQGMDLIKSR